jgi:hypothetical protein
MLLLSPSTDRSSIPSHCHPVQQQTGLQVELSMAASVA